MSAHDAAYRVDGTHRFRTLAGTGLVATFVAMVAAGVVALLASRLGVGFEVDGGETIPVAGIAVQAGVFSALGVVIAAGLLRWSPRPAERFVRTALVLTAISLVPPLLWGSGVGTVVALVVLHLVVAGVMVPALSRGLRAVSPR